jgi:tRNA threonylcarbamoyladenosine biosynthesis protein TsaE
MEHMSTDLTLSIKSGSLKQTEQLAERLGRNLTGGEIIELFSDLGGGKTTFVRGLARGVGSNDHVSSPSFKLNNIYKGQKLTLNHFDFYRLDDAGLMKHDLEEARHNKNEVIVIEWAEIVKDVLPANRLKIDIKVTSENERQLILSFPKRLAYLIEGLK